MKSGVETIANDKWQRRLNMLSPLAGKPKGGASDDLELSKEILEKVWFLFVTHCDSDVAF